MNAGTEISHSDMRNPLVSFHQLRFGFAACPAIDRQNTFQFIARTAGCIAHPLQAAINHLRNRGEGNASLEKSRHGDFVGGIEHHRRVHSRAGGLSRQIQAGLTDGIHGAKIQAPGRT